MSGRTESSLAALLLVQRVTDVAASPLKAKEYWGVLEAVGDPAVLLGADAATVADRASVDGPTAARIAARLEGAGALAYRLEELAHAGVHLLASVDAAYPSRLRDRLGHDAPPALYLAGDPGLLSRSLFGIVGARAVAKAGVAVAKQAAKLAVKHGWGVVSGGAKGVDRHAMGAALGAGGPVVVVLADSLDRTLRNPEVRRAVRDGSLCVCTPYKPTAGFSVGNAIGRNKVVYGLSQATFVVAAADESGGTWAGAVEALDRGWMPVTVWVGGGRGEGNAALVARGAHPVDDIDRLFLVSDEPSGRRPGPPRQLALGV